MMGKIAVFTLLSISTTGIFAANATATKQNNETYNWTINTQDDGLIQLLGPGDTRKFIVNVAESHHGKPADIVTVNCNAGDNQHKPHQLTPGSSITCFPHFSDTISVYIDAKSFKNGAEGTYQYEFIQTP